MPEIEEYKALGYKREAGEFEVGDTVVRLENDYGACRAGVQYIVLGMGISGVNVKEKETGIVLDTTYIRHKFAVIE